MGTTGAAGKGGERQVQEVRERGMALHRPVGTTRWGGRKKENGAHIGENSFGVGHTPPLFR